MFDRFTEQARRVLVLAAGEARVGGRASLDTGDLLVALANEDTGIASAALTNAGAVLTEVTVTNRETPRLAESSETDHDAMAPTPRRCCRGCPAGISNFAARRSIPWWVTTPAGRKSDIGPAVR